jgi:hypothetical protein
MMYRKMYWASEGYLWEMVQNAFELTNAQMEEYLGEKPEMPADAV